MKRQLEFETSPHLKELFRNEMQQWSAKHQLGLDELAKRCGVSSSYLAHIGRYGRIPSKPILILLALNFEMPEPEEILQVAGINDRWPYSQGTRLMEGTDTEPGFLSVKFDMPSFVQAIKAALSSESPQPRIGQIAPEPPLKSPLNDILELQSR